MSREVLENYERWLTQLRIPIFIGMTNARSLSLDPDFHRDDERASLRLVPISIGLTDTLR